MAKVSWRILPLVVLIYFVAYIDRTNVGFAAIGMNRDLGFSLSTYAWGAGIFFVGYLLFEVPSNVMLHRIGARIWIARIMVTWGIASGLMMLVAGPISFVSMRFLLGVAEAGFFPGVLLYFTYWFPTAYRARVVAALFLAVPGSNAVAAALSGAILGLDGRWGLAGWQWIFLLESAPAVVLAPVVLKVFVDKPGDAPWLDEDEREWLIARLRADERAAGRAGTQPTLAGALKHPRVWALSLIYLTITSATYGITFFLPLIVKSHGLSNVQTGFVTAVPYVVGTAAMIAWAWSSDRRNERRWHFIIGCVVAAAGLVGAAAPGASLPGAVVALSIAAIGLYGSKPAFWPLPSTFLTGTAAAAGIALVNAVGNLGGLVGPSLVGRIKDATGRYQPGLGSLAACALLSGAIAYLATRNQASSFKHQAPS